jgi:hypothetical protein
LPVYSSRRPTSFRNHLDLAREPLAFRLRPQLHHVLAHESEGRIAEHRSERAHDRDGRREEYRRARGDEIVQLYLHDVVSSVTRPTKELRGFERVTLKPGETKT